MIDNSEWERLIEILEELPDQSQAASLLKELNDKTSALSQLIMNQDQNLGHAEWKTKCDLAKEELDKLISQIESL